MTEFSIRIASRVAAVRAMFDSSRAYCADFLCDDVPELFLEITAQDIAHEREMFRRTALSQGLPVYGFTDAQLEITAIQRKLTHALLEFDTLLFHGSAIAVDGAAYLFTAKSGTGKSTHTRLWRELLGARAVMINDDKPFLRVTRDGVLVCGSPWNGKHRLGADICVPLRAICILGRASDNHIAEIPAQEALASLLQQSARPSDARKMAKYLDLIDKIASQTALYRLGCNMQPQAAQVAFEAMAPKS